MIQAVFFDLYETLITEWENGKKKATYSVEELGLEYDIYNKEWAARRDQRMDGTFPDHQSALIDILKVQKKIVNDHVIEKVHKNRVYCKLVPFESIDPEIICTLNKLRQMNIKIGLISNCSPEEVEAWDTCTLAHLFDDVVFSYKVKQIKPNPDIYLTACKNLNVLPQNSIFIGDGGSNELFGASNAGMRAFHATWFQPSSISKQIVGYLKLTNPYEIIDLLEGSV